MIRRLAISAALLATAVGTGVSSVPAAAQSREDDARFDAAQQRLDSELAIFKREFDRYQRIKVGGGPSGQRYEDPRVYGDDAEAGPRDDDSRMVDEPIQRGADGRDQGEYEPRL